MKMPDLATTDSAIKLIRWLVEPGQAVKRGQPLLEIETDKATSEVESIATGVLKEARALPDDMVFAGQVIAVFEVAGAMPGSPEAAAQTVIPPPSAKPSAVTPAPLRSRSGGLFARNRAAGAPGAIAKTPVAALSPIQTDGGPAHASEQADHSAFLFADFGQCRANDAPAQSRGTQTTCLGRYVRKCRQQHAQEIRTHALAT